jgi:hypothetical protein
MVDFNDDTNGKQEVNKYLGTTRYGAEPQANYTPHPLFPREDGGPESRDIHFISFCRRRSDGAIDYSPEDRLAGEINSWVQVVGPWGGGEYKAVGKDRNHRVVAWYPERSAEWLLFDTEPKPFTLREQRDRPSPPVAAAPPAPLAPLTIAECFLLDLIRKDRSSPASSPLSPEAAMLEMITTHEALRMLREQWPRTSRPAAAPPAPVAAPAPLAAPAPVAAPAPPALTPVEYALLDLVRELRASQASSIFTVEAAMMEMIKSQGELLRTVLSAVRPQGLGETGGQPTAEQIALAEQLVEAVRASLPKPQGAVAATNGVSARRRYAASRRRDVRGRWQKP